MDHDSFVQTPSPLPEKKHTSAFSVCVMERAFFQGMKRVARYGVVLTLLLVFLFMLYPSIAKGVLFISPIFDILPSMFHDIVKVEWLNNYQAFPRYFGFTVQFFQMLSCIYAVMLGVTALVREQEDGTIEFLYSQPISRWGIMFSKFAGRLCSLLVMNLWCMMVTAVLCAIVAPQDSAWVNLFLRVFLFGLLVQTVYLVFGFFCSAIIKDITVSSSIAFGAFLFTWLAGFLAQKLPEVSFLRYFSPYTLADPEKMVQTGFSTDPFHLCVCLVLVVIFLASGYLIYAKKEFCA